MRVNKRVVLLALFAVALLPSLALALTFTRDVVDHVVATRAVKIEVCETVAPPCVTTEGSNSFEATKCLRENAFSGDCISAPQTLVFGELAVYEKNSSNGTQPPTLYVVLFNDVVYRGDSIAFDYYYVGDDPHNLPDAARGGEYWWPDGRTGKGLKSLSAQRLDILNPDFEPYGWRSVKPSYFMTYFEPNGELRVYLSLAGKHYKLVSVKKEVKNQEWTPPETPEAPPAPELKPAKTCSQQNGWVCEYGYWCVENRWLEASDSKSCCDIQCKPPSSRIITPRTCRLDNETGLEVCQSVQVTPSGPQPSPATPQCAFTAQGCCNTWKGATTCAPISPNASCGAGFAPQVTGCGSDCSASWQCMPTTMPTASATPTPNLQCVFRAGACCNANNWNVCMAPPPNACGAGLTPRVQVCHSNCSVVWECVATPTPTPSPTPTASATPTPTPSASATPTPCSMPTPSPSPSPSPESSPSPSPSPS
ncbi:MAG: hypothetical protein V1817_00410 [Candidatus Micrarchaeota archaeon]